MKRIKNIEKCKVLSTYDEYDILEFDHTTQPKTYTSINDILSDDELGILNNDTDIFELKNIKANKS